MSKNRQKEFTFHFHPGFQAENVPTTKEGFETICKKYGIKTKDGKIVHPLFEEEFSCEDLRDYFKRIHNERNQAGIPGKKTGE